jgi:hypothetical protein
MTAPDMPPAAVKGMPQTDATTERDRSAQPKRIRKAAGKKSAKR